VAAEKKDFISIILPVYNEGRNIRQAYSEIEKHFKIPHELLVIYDFEEDDTLPVAKLLQNKAQNLKLIKNSSSGVIHAVQTGFKKAKGNIVVVMSCDLTDDPKTLLAMLKKIQEGYDIIGATRYARGGKRLNQMGLKSFISRIIGISTPFIFSIPLTDLTNGFKMYRKEVLQHIPIESTGGWEFTMELMLKARDAGYRIAEVPTISRARRYGKSKFLFAKWLPKYLRWYWYGLSSR